MRKMTMTMRLLAVAVLLLVADIARAQSAPPTRTLAIGEPESGVSLNAAGAEVWAQCVMKDEETGQSRTQRSACRTIGWGLFIDDTFPDKVVLCRDCYTEDPQADVGQNMETILGLVDPRGAPLWGMRHDDWFDSTPVQNDSNALI